MEGTEPKLIIATGTKGVGKTHTTLEKIEAYIKEPQLDGMQGRKVLIYDVNEEYNNEELARFGQNRGRPFEYQIKTLPIQYLEQYSKQRRPEVRRILPRDEKGRMVNGDAMIEILERILHSYTGGLLLLEDYNAYLIGNSTQHIISSLTRNRHKDLDIYIHLQSLAAVTTRMWQNADYMRLHKQMDNVGRYKDRITEIEKYYIAEKLVNHKYKTNPRFYCYVDNKLHKITGYFDKKDFAVACYSYLLENQDIIRTIITRSSFNQASSSKLSSNEAMKRAIAEKIREYYGNSI